MTTKTKKENALLKAVIETKKTIEDVKQHSKNITAHLKKGFSDGCDFAQSEFGVEVFNMTPAEAMDILTHRNSIVKDDAHIQTNRRIDPRIVNRIKNELQGDDWFFESANVAFNKDGILIDGQHTLAGIVAAGKEAEVLLKTGCRNKSVQKIDVSRSRTTGQRLKFSGEFPVDESDSSSKFRADMAGLVLRSQIGLNGTKKKKGCLGDRAWYNDKQIIKTHNENKEAIDYFLKNKSSKKGFKSIGLLAPLVIAFKDNPEKVKNFYSKFLNVNVKIRSRNTSPLRMNGLAETVLLVKASSKTSEVGARVFKKLMHGHSEIKFWFTEMTNAVEAFINNKTYTPDVKD
jgi:hypothetical protein